MVNVMGVIGRVKSSVVSKVKEHKRKKEELRRVYEEEYRKALIKAMKEKARKKAREKAFAPSPFERIWGAIAMAGKVAKVKGAVKPKRKAKAKPGGPIVIIMPKEYTPGWAKYDIIDRSTGPNPWAGLTSGKREKKFKW